MSESEWLSCPDPVSMLQSVASTAREDQLRRFGIACCRRSWSLLQDERSRLAIEAAERFVGGTASARDLDSACDAAEMAYEVFNVRATDPSNRNAQADRVAMYAAYAAHMLTWPVFDYALAIEVACAADSAVRLAGISNDEAIAQAELLRQHVVYSQQELGT